MHQRFDITVLYATYAQIYYYYLQIYYQTIYFKTTP